MMNRSFPVAATIAVAITMILVAGASAPAEEKLVLAVDSGIEGTVTIGPTSPVATPGSADDSKPYATELVISPKEGLHLKRPVRVKTGADGSFSVALEPGTYVIEAGGSQSPPTLKPLEVSVEPGRYTTVAVPFDSGIR